MSQRERAGRQWKLWHKQSKKGPFPSLTAQLCPPARRLCNDPGDARIQIHKPSAFPPANIIPAEEQSAAARDGLRAQDSPVGQWLGFVCLFAQQSLTILQSHVWGLCDCVLCWGVTLCTLEPMVFAICLQMQPDFDSLGRLCTHTLHKYINANTSSFLCCSEMCWIPIHKVINYNV